MPTLRPAQVASTVYYGGLRTLGVTAVRRRWLDAALILCYHNVVAPGDDTVREASLHLAADRFERQMRWLAAHYQVVTLRELVDRLAVGRSLGTLAAVTFDDGYAGVYAHALPILQRLGLPATVFLVAEAVGTATAFAWDGEPVPASHPPAAWPTILAARGRIDAGGRSATPPPLPTRGRGSRCPPRIGPPTGRRSWRRAAGSTSACIPPPTARCRRWTMPRSRRRSWPAAPRSNTPRAGGRTSSPIHSATGTA